MTLRQLKRAVGLRDFGVRFASGVRFLAEDFALIVRRPHRLRVARGRIALLH